MLACLSTVFQIQLPEFSISELLERLPPIQSFLKLRDIVIGILVGTMMADIKIQSYDVVIEKSSGIKASPGGSQILLGTGLS